jgi:hypothetical protein
MLLSLSAWLYLYMGASRIWTIAVMPCRKRILIHPLVLSYLVVKNCYLCKVGIPLQFSYTAGRMSVYRQPWRFSTSEMVQTCYSNPTVKCAEKYSWLSPVNWQLWREADGQKAISLQNKLLYTKACGLSSKSPRLVPAIREDDLTSSLLISSD